MKRSFAIIAAAILLAAGAVFAADEDKKMEMPKPAPELQKLNRFVGTWNITGQMQKSPMGPAGRMTATESCSWFPGGYFLLCRSDGSGPMGKIHGLDLFGYNAQEKNYTYESFDSMGTHESARGTVEGNVWTWTNEEKFGDKMTQSRFVVTEASPETNTMRWSMSSDGTAWTTLFDGRETRAKAAKIAEPKKKNDGAKK